MRINRRYAYQTLSRVTRPDGVRHYLCPETNTLVPSVTTVISETLDKKGLQEWYAWVGRDKAERVKKEATDLGSLVHTHVENHIVGIPRPSGTNLIRKLSERMADQIIERGLCDVDEVWGQEVALYHPGLYAGTTDLVGIYRGRPAIMDHKTAKKMRKREDIEGYMMQLGAYSLAHDHLFGTNIELGVIFMVTREFAFQAIVLSNEELEHYKTKFMLSVEQYVEKHR